MHENCQLLFKKYALDSFKEGQKVLEIGPDNMPSTLQQFVVPSGIQWHTLDIKPSPTLTYSQTSEYDFPIPSNTYDIVLAANVMEHVKNLWLWVKEIHRVCKPGGVFIVIVPTSWSYHPVPVDCWRVYPEGLKTLLEGAGFTVTTCHWESLERPGYRRYLPGISWKDQGRLWKWFSLIGGRLGLPVERSYDTFAIARKGSPS